MDNQQIDITSEGRAGIGHALAIIWNSAAPGGKATHYKVARLREETKYYCRDDNKGAHHASHSKNLVVDEVNGIPTLILLWHEENGCSVLPYPLTSEQAAGFIADWLVNSDYGSQPDHDGSNGRGWRLFTESWGHVAGHHYAIVAAQPEWAMYGK